MVRSSTLPVASANLHAHAERRKGRKISQQYPKTVPTLPFSLVAWWRLRAFFHGENKMYQLAAGKKIREKSAMRDTFTSDTCKYVRSVFGRRKMWIICRRCRGHRGADCRSSLHGAVNVVTLPRVLPGVLKAYFSMRHLFSSKIRTVWPKAPHKSNKPRSCPNRFQIAHPICQFFVRVSVCMRARAFVFKYNFRTKLDYYDGLPLKHRIDIILSVAMPATWERKKILTLLPPKKHYSVVFSVIKALFLHSMTTTQQHQHQAGPWIDGASWKICYRKSLWDVPRVVSIQDSTS